LAGISLQSRLSGGGSSRKRTVLCQIPCNREKYTEIQAIFAGTVAVEFAQNAVPEPTFSPSAPVGWKIEQGILIGIPGNSIGQIKDTTRGPIGEDQQKDVYQDLTCPKVSQVQT
jgi:hypothetical protein